MLLCADVCFRIVHFLRDNVTTGCHSWTNNACESLHHILKQTVQWLPHKLAVYIKYLWPISPMQCFYRQVNLKALSWDLSSQVRYFRSCKQRKQCESVYIFCDCTLAIAITVNEGLYIRKIHCTGLRSVYTM